MKLLAIMNLLYNDIDYESAYYFQYDSKIYKRINNKFYYFDTDVYAYTEDLNLFLICDGESINNMTSVTCNGLQYIITDDVWYIVDIENSSHREYTPKYKAKVSGNKFSVAENNGLIYYYSTDESFVVYDTINDKYTTYEPILKYTPYWKHVKDDCIYALTTKGILCGVNPLVGEEEEILDLSFNGCDSGEVIINNGIPHVIGSSDGSNVHIRYECSEELLYVIDDASEEYNSQKDYVFSIDNNMYMIIDGKHYLLTYEDVTDTEIQKIMYVTKDGEGYFKGKVCADSGYFKGDIYAKTLNLLEDAVIKGTIIATNGQIAGFLISDQGQHMGNALESAHYSDSAQTGYGTYLSAENGDLWNYSSDKKCWMALQGGGLRFANYDPSTQTVAYLDSKYTLLSNDGLHVNDVESFNPTTMTYVPGLNTQVRSSGLIIENHISSTDVESTNVKKNGLFIRDTLNYRNVQVTQKGLIVDCDDEDTGIHNTTEVRQDRVTTNGVALTSDRKAKENIAEIDDEISKQLILGLEPVTFNYKSSTRNRTHMGFIAQDVSSLCEELDMPDMSLYEARIKSEEGMSNDYVEGTDESELNWYLNYTELIAPLIKTVQLQDEEIQLQNKEIEEQASEIAELKERLAKLEAILLQ